MTEINASQVTQDEYNIYWAEVEGELLELFIPDEDFNEEQMLEAGYEQTSLTLEDVSPKHAGTVYGADSLFINR